MNRSIKVICAAALLCFCATQTMADGNARTVTVEKSFDAVWENLVQYFTSHNLSIQTIAKDSGVIYVQLGKPVREIAECGSMAAFESSGSRTGANVFVSRAGASPVVTVNTEFVLLRRQNNGVIAETPCNSTGKVEAEILSAAAR